MLNIRRLQYEDIAPGLPFHGALVVLEAGSRERHTHDFGEMFFVLDGSGQHEANDASLPLEQGTLVLIRPTDRHCFRVSVGRSLCFINIAYPIGAWHEFINFAALPCAESWTSDALPPTIQVSRGEHDRCVFAFREALHTFQGHPSRLALGRFWVDILSCFVNASTPDVDDAGMPSWLRDACGRMQEEELQVGFERLLEMSGVSAAHLARTMNRHTGQTPTEWINTRRAALAAHRLATTEEGIFDIAMDCGFENLSYFYRVFRRQYGLPPQAYRTHVRRSVIP
jgi:AraC family cel operon transcriptional repressor